MDTLELHPSERIAYPLLLCAGQELKLKICASSPVEASIGFESCRADADPPAPFNFNPEVSCFVFDHDVKRTAYYRLVIANTLDQPIDAAIEISARLRGPSVRTRFEFFTALLSYFLRKSEPLCRVVATLSSGNLCDAENGDGT